MTIENTRDILNRIYAPIVAKSRGLTAALAEHRPAFEIIKGFYNCHYHKNALGEYTADVYPIPVLSIRGLCDIEIDCENISLTAKLAKENITNFDWHKLGGAAFEVYGVKDYLKDYGDSQNVQAIAARVFSSEEEAFFVTIRFNFNMDNAEIINFIYILQENDFYY